MAEKSRKNECYTYFLITGDFQPSQITQMLGLEPYETHTKGEMHRGGKTSYTFSSWAFNRVDEYNVITDEQMVQTLTPLADKTDILKEIKRKFNAELALMIVPSLVSSEITPALAPSLDVMAFCVETGTEIDIDLYLD